MDLEAIITPVKTGKLGYQCCDCQKLWPDRLQNWGIPVSLSSLSAPVMLDEGMERDP